MNAVILAAGVGTRLHSLTQHRPKCLIEIGGRSLLARYFDALAKVNIQHIVILVGYKHEMIREAVGTFSGSHSVQFILNEDYRRGSVGSLWRAREMLDDDALIMDADVLFHQAILDRLVQSAHPNALLMDETVQQTTEECMVVVRNNRVVALTKRMPTTYDVVGEGVGFLKVAKADGPKLIQAVEGRINCGQLDMDYEDALEEFFRSTEVGYETIGGFPWVEIDFPEDVQRAQNDVLPKLHQHV